MAWLLLIAYVIIIWRLFSTFDRTMGFLWLGAGLLLSIWSWTSTDGGVVVMGSVLLVVDIICAIIWGSAKTYDDAVEGTVDLVEDALDKRKQRAARPTANKSRR